MRIKELRQKTEKELSKLLTDSRRHLGELRFNLGSKKSKNVKEISQTRKDIARLYTILKEKQHGK